MMRGLRPIAIGLASLALLAGCETGVGLEPAAPVSGSDSVSRTTAGGIVFAAATPEWPGPVQIDAEVTPMRLSRIYFERIPESVARATLHAELDDVASARPYAAFDIPFIATN